MVTLPALLREANRLNVDPTVSPIPYGRGEEIRYLEEFCKLAGAPDPDKPYRAIWAEGDGSWQDKHYAGGGLQRQRTYRSGRGEALIQLKRDPAANRPRDEWGLTATPGADLLSAGLPPVRLIDLAIWLGRNVDTATIDPLALAAAGVSAGDPDIDKLDAWFKHEFKPDRGDLVGTIYLDIIPDEYRAIAFAAEPVSEDTYQELGVLPPAPTVVDGLDSVISNLENSVRASGFELPEGLVGRVLTAWLRGDLVVLVGQPGTGKTLFATSLGRAMKEEFTIREPLLIPVRADFDEAELIGYERLDGTVQYQKFAEAVLLDEDTPLEARVVILEEFNLASVETYLSAVLIALQARERAVQLPGGTTSTLPIDTFVIATCNSFRDEPETRTRVSSPTKRRSTTITMPNVLADRYEDDDDALSTVTDLVAMTIANERGRVEARQKAGLASQFDSLRSTALGSVSEMSDFSDAAQEALVNVVEAILETPTGRSWFTLGILRDVVMALVMADRNADAELTALGNAVADKIVHQLRGSHSDAQPLLEVAATLPNGAEIGRLIERTKDGPSDELLPLL